MLRRELGETNRENVSLKRNLLEEKERSSKLETDFAMISKEYEESLASLLNIEERYSEEIVALCEGTKKLRILSMRSYQSFKVSLKLQVQSYPCLERHQQRI